MASALIRRAFVLLAFVLLLVRPADAASRYWVGGGSSTSWAATGSTNWAATDGGAGNQSVPGASDDVFFTLLSGSVTAALDANITVKSVTCTGFIGTITHAASTTLTINTGPFLLVPLMTYTLGDPGTSSTAYTNTSGTAVITSAGKALGDINRNGTGGTTQLADVPSTIHTLTLTRGTFDFNGKSIDPIHSIIFTGTQTKVLKLFGATLTFRVTATSFIAQGTATTGSSFAVGDTGAWVIWSGGTSAFGNIQSNDITIPYDVYFMDCQEGTSLSTTGNTGVVTFTNLTLMNQVTTNLNRSEIQLGHDIVVTGTLTITGGSYAQPFQLASNTDSIARTVTAGTVVLNDWLSFVGIIASGASAPWVPTNPTWSKVGNLDQNITFQATRDLYWVSGTGNWEDASKWSQVSGVVGSETTPPLSQDHVHFDSHSFTASGQTINLNGITATPFRLGSSIDWTGATNTPTWKTNASTTNGFYVYGSCTLISAMTLSFTQHFQFRSSPPETAILTSAGHAWGGNVFFNAINVAQSLADDVTTTGGSFHIAGSNAPFDTQGHNITALSAGLTQNGQSLGVTASLQASLITLTGTSGTLWVTENLGTNTTSWTLNAGTSTVKFIGIGSSSRTFAGGGLTYSKVWFSSACTCTWVITGANTYGSFISDNGGKTFTLPASTTQTVTTFTVRGDVGSMTTFQSSTPATAWTLSGSGSVVCDYCSIKDSTGSGTTSPFAAPHSTNSGHNTGWIFTGARFVLDEDRQ